MWVIVGYVPECFPCGCWYEKKVIHHGCGKWRDVMLGPWYQGRVVEKSWGEGGKTSIEGLVYMYNSISSSKAPSRP